jgi:hypothetical protein
MGWFRLATFLGFSILPFLALRAASASEFRFERDTLAFRNDTVFEYRDGQIQKKGAGRKEKEKAYTRRCFVMSRTALQFHKFARFDPRGAPLDDKALAERVRKVTRQRPWHPALSARDRIVFPGYANLRALSKARGPLLQKHIGLGWPTYVRVGNFRMFIHRDNDEYQVKMRDDLVATLARGEFFVAYLSDYPHFRINHSVLVYAKKPVRSPSGIEHYLVYDPNHAEAPRVLRWSPKLGIFNYEKDTEFVGGFTRVYQVYGKAWQ